MRTMVLYPLFSFLFILTQLTAFSQQFNLLKDINPGSDGTDNLVSINVNGQLYFTATDPDHGTELWKTDGTEAGTVLVKDIYNGPESSQIRALMNVNGLLYFSADDGVSGEELWKSDGTGTGTVMVKDINPGMDRGFGSTFLNVNGIIYFEGNNGVDGYELWKTDGTEAGTTMIKDISQGVYTSGSQTGMPRSGFPRNLTLVNGVIFFNALDETHGDELWKTDGTGAGTILVKDVNPGIIPSTIHDCKNVNGSLYFTAFTDDYALWKSDGTAAGTVMIKYLGFSHSFFNWGTTENNTYYFLGTEGLWKSDGTENGTDVVKIITDGISSPSFLTNVNGLLYFVGYDDFHGWELWKSDGTLQGTCILKDITPGTGSSDFLALTKIGNRVMISVSDGSHGYELWVSDGTEAGTQLLQDIVPGSSSTNISQIVESGGKTYINPNTTSYGRELWVAVTSVPTPLPLRFVEFKGSIVNSDGILEWKTDNEINTSSFVLERSLDGNTFKPVGSLMAANVAGAHTYHYTDKDITSLGVPVVYYRVKETDIDGKSVYSSIVALLIDGRNNFVRLYSNPVRNEISMAITTGQRQKMQWKLIDNSGRVIKNGSIELTAGSTTMSIDIANARPGIYYLQLQGVSVQQVIRVVKQ
jgi:trimeric autotransporter adhesin